MKSLLLESLLTLDWEAPWDSLPQVLWQRYQCSDGCCISSFGPVLETSSSQSLVSGWPRILSATSTEHYKHSSANTSAVRRLWFSTTVVSTSEIQLFNAAIVLLVDLLFSPKYEDADYSSVSLSRLMTRDKIREAIELLRTRSDAEGSSSPQDSQAEQVETSAQRNVVVLEALMEIEAEESSNNEERSGASSTGTRLGGQQVKADSGARKPIKNKVMDILEAHQGNAQIAAAAMEPPSLNSFSAPDTSVFPPTPTDGFQDLDVLQLLSNDPY